MGSHGSRWIRIPDRTPIAALRVQIAVREPDRNCSVSFLQVDDDPAVRRDAVRCGPATHVHATAYVAELTGNE